MSSSSTTTEYTTYTTKVVDEDVIVLTDEEEDSKGSKKWPEKKVPTCWEEAGEVIITFGKYRGQPMRSMITTPEKRKYLKWCRKYFKSMWPSTREAIKLALEEYKRVKEEAKYADKLDGKEKSNE